MTLFLVKNLNLGLLSLRRMEEYEVYVNSILDSWINKRRKNLLQYLVEWESWEAITNADNALSDFHRQYPEKPGPHANVCLAGASAVERG